MSKISKFIKKEIKIMSKYVDDGLALIKTISNGSAEDTATKDAVSQLQKQIASDEADEADVKTLVNALIAQLAAAPASTDTGSPQDDKVAGSGSGA